MVEAESAIVDPRITRGYLNNNPGNMDRGEPPWNGEIRDVAQCTNDVQRSELTHGRFCVFTDAEHGIRAMAKNLQAYRARLGCKSVRDFINRWAPPNENNTEAYIQSVAQRLHLPADAEVVLNRETLAALIDAIIRVECAGMPYENGEIERGIALA